MTQPPGYIVRLGDPYAASGQPTQPHPPWSAASPALPQTFPPQAFPPQPASLSSTATISPDIPYGVGDHSSHGINVDLGAGGGAPYQPSPPARNTWGRGFIVIVIALAVFVLGGGGAAAYLVFGRSEGTGASSPSKAVDQFLTAVFRDNNVQEADALVCASAKDTTSLRKQMEKIRQYDLKYKTPSYSWPKQMVESRKGNTATVVVPVKLSTRDDRVSEQRLTFTTIKNDGWLICEIG